MIEKINSFYVSGTKNIRPDLFCEYAQGVAKNLGKIAQDPTNPKRISKNGVSPTQIRKLFDEVKRYERLIVEGNSESWNKQFPYIKMMKSKVSYSVARAKKSKPKDALYYDNLAAFMGEGIDLIKSEQDYHIFVSLFEAIYGFYYEIGRQLEK